MAESIWSYEGDVAPQRNIHFPEAAPSRAGSRFTYSTPAAQRFAAESLAPAQAAIRQAEEEDLKRRDAELAYQHNKSIHEASKEKARQEAELLAMEGPLTERLEQVQALISRDPLKAESALAEVVVQNSKAVSASEGSRIAIDQMREAIRTYKQQQDDLDSSTFRQFQTSLNAGNLPEAKKFYGQLKNATRIAEAGNLIINTEYQANAIQQVKTAEQYKAAQEKAADEQSRTIKAAREQLYNLDTEIVPGPMGGTTKQFTAESMLKLEGVARELRLSKEEIGKGLKDPFVFQQELVERSFNSVAGAGAKGNVGGVIGTMTPSP